MKKIKYVGTLFLWIAGKSEKTNISGTLSVPDIKDQTPLEAANLYFSEAGMTQKFNSLFLGESVEIVLQEAAVI